MNAGDRVMLGFPEKYFFLIFPVFFVLVWVVTLFVVSIMGGVAESCHALWSDPSAAGPEVFDAESHAWKFHGLQQLRDGASW